MYILLDRKPYITENIPEIILELFNIFVPISDSPYRFHLILDLKACIIDQCECGFCNNIVNVD